MEEKAGDESLDNWSPFGRTVHQPTRIQGLYLALEASLGSEMYAATASVHAAHAYMRNKIGKDGLHLIRPMDEALLKSINAKHDLDEYSNLSETQSYAFTGENIRNGSAG